MEFPRSGCEDFDKVDDGRRPVECVYCANAASAWVDGECRVFFYAGPMEKTEKNARASWKLISTGAVHPLPLSPGDSVTEAGPDWRKWQG